MIDAELLHDRYDGAFAPVGVNSNKIRCTACGRTGYDVFGYGWMVACLRGHVECKECGRVGSLRLDGTPRYHRCGGKLRAMEDV